MSFSAACYWPISTAVWAVFFHTKALFDERSHIEARPNVVGGVKSLRPELETATSLNVTLRRVDGFLSATAPTTHSPCTNAG